MKTKAAKAQSKTTAAKPKIMKATKPKLTTTRSKSTTIKSKATTAKPKMTMATAKTRAAATKPKTVGIKVKVPTKEVAAEIAAKLMAAYPDADCELNFANTYQLITSVILSAQCTDQQVNRVTAKLFKQFPTAKDLAQADIDKIKEIIRPTGYFNAKAKNIQACAQSLVTKYGGEVPTNLEELILLPGVGRKTANVVLGVAHNIPGWTVDTHVQRLSKRLGFTQNSDPYKIEMDLQKLFPENTFDWTKLSITIIWHGRRCCYARKPNCGQCPVQDLCPSSEV